MLCKNNWINLTWDGKTARDKTENIRVEFLRRARVLMDFDHACDRVASEIYDSHKNLYLALSGGSDSEYVATCLHRNGIPFTPLILRYNLATSNDQHYETWYAMRWCRTHNVEPVIVDIDDYVTSDHGKAVYLKHKPRLLGGSVTAGFLHQYVNELGGKLVTGYQIEYYPDQEQMTYLEPQLGDYRGFVLEESDLYIETLAPNQHPWAFYYWSPEVMSSFVNAWDTNLNMCDNKARIYKTSPRPKFLYPANFFPGKQWIIRKTLSENNWGTIDCALLGDRKSLLDQLLE